MNGAESLITTLVNGGVDVCFTNPGTSEMHFVAALDEVEGMRCVLGLFEGVLSGAADGYARMARKPASTLLHLGPGLGNALANIHNAKKGHSPMINIVGDHATYHLQYDAPLTSDIEGIAGPVSHWVHSSQSAEEIARDAAAAVVAAGRNRVATLILPADVSWNDNPTGAVEVPPLPHARPVDAGRVEAAAKILRSGKRCMLMIGGGEIDAQRGLMLSRIGKATGARVSTETFPARVARGAGTANLERLPYLAELAIDHIKDLEHLILIGASAPVSIFAYPNVASEIAPPGCEQLVLAGPGDDIDGALEALLEQVDAVDVSPDVLPLSVPDMPEGDLNADSVAVILARRIPENTVIVDEGITSGLSCYGIMATAQPHDWLNQTGGAIGWGLPAAVGAAIACPERRVLCLEGDGSAMYTIQSLWTMARENLDVTVVVFSNRKYSILELEFMRTGARGGVPGPKAASMLDISNPVMNFVEMARGMGVEASLADTIEAFDAQLAEALQSSGPRLIEAVLPTVF
jgi:acetolactate synthase-1/2/3 large subunit